jgi:hypothetical protein
MSPVGFAAIQEAASKMSSGSGVSNVLYFKLANSGDSATVRFLEQGDEVYSYWYHDFTHIDKKNGWKTKLACLDQDDDGTPCPGCEEDLPRKFQGLINVIWRDAPLYAKDSEGNIDWSKQKGTADQIAVWRAGIELFNKTLSRKDVTYKGLSSRDFEIVRDGIGLKTTYSVEPVVTDGETKAKAMSKDDKELAKEKYNLEELARFTDYETAQNIINKKIAEYNDLDSDDDDDDVSEFLNKKPFND